MKTILFLLGILIPLQSYGLNEEQKIIFSRHVSLYQFAKSPEELSARIKSAKLKREVLNFIATNKIEGLAKISQNGGVLEFTSGKERLEFNFNRIDDGEIVLNRAEPIDITKAKSFGELFSVFEKSLQKPDSFSLLSLLIPFAIANEKDGTEGDDLKTSKDKKKGLFSGLLFSLGFLEVLHPCDGVAKLSASWKEKSAKWKEHCDHIDDVIPLGEWAKEKVEKIKRFFNFQKSQ